MMDSQEIKPKSKWKRALTYPYQTLIILFNNINNKIINNNEKIKF
jgi:hypothetical protein